MDGPIAIYKCLCDELRLRILNLLNHGPLCVCHIQEVLGESQVKVSKQLAYMKRLGLVVVTKRANWRIDSLPESASPLLRENLKCLQDLALEGGRFGADLKRLRTVDTGAACFPVETSCCE